MLLDGPEEKECEFQFDWKTRSLGADDAVLDGVAWADADELVLVIEDFARDQTLVELTWRERVLVGYIAEFTQVEGFEGEYTAQLTFKPTQSPRWARRPPVVLQTPPVSLFEDLKGDFEAEAAPAPSSTPAAAFGELERRLDNVSATLRRFDGLVHEVDEAGTAWNQIVRGVGEVLTALTRGTAELREVASQHTASLVQSDDPLAQLQAAAYQRDLIGKANRGRHRAAAERLYYQRMERGQLLGVHTVMRGETVWAISWRWYGTTEEAALLMATNALATTSPPAGMRLVIPRVGRS